MPDHVGDQPSPDGEGPEELHHGAADDAFASVVLDDDFVRAATLHEPSAAERTAAARFPTGPAGAGEPADPEPEDGGYDDHGLHDPHEDALPSPYGPHGGPLRPYRSHPRWQRPVAWLLAVVIGVSMIALVLGAVHRGDTPGRGPEPVPPPATNGAGAPPPEVLPAASAGPLPVLTTSAGTGRGAPPG